MKIKTFFLIAISLLLIANTVYATDLTPTSCTRPTSAEYTGEGFKVAFTIANQNVLAAPANRWSVTVLIKDAGNNTIFSASVSGVLIDPFTSVNMETSTTFIPTGSGNYTVEITVNHLDEVNPANDQLTQGFTVYDEPQSITNISPTNNATDVAFQYTMFSWLNGSTPFEQTNVFINTSSSTIDWNSTPTITSTNTSFNNFTYSEILPQGTLITWGVQQINPAGMTNNGPFQFTTILNLPDEISDIMPPNGASNVLLTEPLFWNNGDTPFDLTTVHIWPNGTSVDWNANAVITNTLPNFNSYTPPEPWESNTEVWWGVSQTNNTGTTHNGPYSFNTINADPPYPITNISPANGATDVDLDAPLSWNNGDGSDIDETQIHVWPNQEAVDWNTHTVLTNTSPIFNSYTPPEPWESNTTVWWGVVQINNNGSTQNGPYSFNTINADPPYPITNISPANGATDVDLDAPLTWDIGDGSDILDTEVHVWTNQASVDWNTGLVISSTDPGFNSYTPTEPWQSNTEVWWGVVQTNSNGSTQNGPFSFNTLNIDPPEPITNISPANGATGVPLDDPITWNNGGVPISQTVVHVWTSQAEVNWNSGGVFTSTLPDYNSYTPTEPWQSNTEVWWGVVQTNLNGSTQNGPFSFITEQLLTDLGIKRIVSPEPLVESFFDVFVQIEIENLGPNTASNWSIPFSITNSDNQTIFSGTIPGTSLPPNTSSIFTYETPWHTDMSGLFTLNSSIQFTNDLDPQNNNNIFSFEVIPYYQGFQILPGQGVDFFQIDFMFENYKQENSPYGLMGVNFDQLASLTSLTFGYINAYSPVLGWFIQNMIFDATLNVVSEYNGLSTIFTLMELQSQPNEAVNNLDAFLMITNDPQFDFIGINTSSFTIGETIMNAEGKEQPVGTIATPIDRTKLPFSETGKNDLVWQHNHVNIEQATNQCAPTSVANSFQWLENEQGVNFPHDHKPGIRDNSLVGQLDIASGRQLHDGVTDEDMLKGKLKYISDNNLQNKLKVKHKSRNDYTYLSKDTVKVGNAKSIPHKDTTVSVIDWIISELKDGEDVELSLSWTGGGGHYVDLIGGGYVQGVPWVAWAHDNNQGVDDKGTADKSDDVVKINGGITPTTGGFQFSYIVNNKIAFTHNSSTSIGIIDCALSESKDTTSTDVDDVNIGLPTGFKLYQNFPNPFNPSTTFRFEVPKISNVKISLYDGLGKEIMLITNRVYLAGTHVITINLENLASGVYYYKMESENFREVKKLILLK